MDRDPSQSEVPYSVHSRPRRRLPIAPYEEAPAAEANEADDDRSRNGEHLEDPLRQAGGELSNREAVRISPVERRSLLEAVRVDAVRHDTIRGPDRVRGHVRGEVAGRRVALVEIVNLAPAGPLDDDDGAVAPLILPVGPVVHDAARDEHVLLNSLGTGVGIGELMAPFVVMFVRVQDQVHLFLDQEVQDVRAGLAVVLARADAVLVESHDDPRNPLRLGVLDLSFRPVVPRRADVVRIMLTVVDPENEVRRNQDEPRQGMVPREIEGVLLPVDAIDGGLDVEGAVGDELVDVSFPGDRVPRIVVPGDDLNLGEELVKLAAPSFLRRVRVAGVPAVAEIPEGEGEVRSGCVELVQAFPEAAPGTEVSRDRKLERNGVFRGSRRPDEGKAHEGHRGGEKDCDGSAWTKRRSHGPPALFRCRFLSISPFRGTLPTNAHAVSTQKAPAGLPRPTRSGDRRSPGIRTCQGAATLLYCGEMDSLRRQPRFRRRATSR